MVEEFRNTRGVLCAHNKPVFVKFQNIAKTFLGTHPTLAKKVTELWFIGRLGGDFWFYFRECGAILGKYYIDDITSHHNHDNITTTA